MFEWIRLQVVEFFDHVGELYPRRAFRPLPLEGRVEIGERIAAPLPGAERLGPIIRHHHERYDGKGYPDRLQGKDIPIEARSPDEVLALGGQPIAAAGAQAWNPAFDVTPGDLLSGIITERGILGQPLNISITKLLT